jgi:enediyne polyketide synthase
MDSRGEPGEAIAIVGIACQFPGARDPAELHDLTMAGDRMFRPVPGLPTTPGRAALLDGWAVEFGEAPDPGPVHKLATETVAQAIADAGRRDSGQRTGLIIASTGVADLCEVTRDGFGIGTDDRFPPLAYLDSLHAVVASCDALRAGKLDAAIAGGAELGVDADWLGRLAAAGELATDTMRVYDAEPTGLLPGDGCGIVVLMRSADARTAGLPVYAEIAGWTVARDVDLAYSQAGLDPAEIGLIEGHGAATAGGDLAELTEFARLRNGGTTSAALGAITANIGHARSAAGVASLIKVIVAMVAGAIPPATGCEHPHQLIESGAAGVRLPAAPEPWPDGTRLAAVNSLGPDGHRAGGAHLVLRREIDRDRGPGRRRRSAQAPSGPTSPGRHSAATAPAATAPVATAPAVPSIPAPAPSQCPASASGERRGAGRIGERPMPATIFALCGAEPTAVAATLDVVAGSASELTETDLCDLARQLAGAAQRAAERGAPLRVTLTATGPRQLSRQARRTAELLRDRPAGVASPYRTTTLIEPGIGVSAGATGTIVLVFPGLAATVSEHTALLGASLNGVRLLDRLGVTADSAVGYSFGEIAGLVWAGCLPTAEAARLAALRGQVLRACTAQPAALVRVSCDGGQASALCTASGAQVAVYETAGSYVLAGPSAAIRDLVRHATALGIPATVLAGGRAQHSPAASRCAAPLRGVLSDTVFEAPRRRLISSVTGLPVTPATDIAELLAGQLAQPVLFAQALEQAVQRPGRPLADLIAVAGPAADPASPVDGHGSAAIDDSGQPPATLAAIATAASGLPAITLPPITLPPISGADAGMDEWLARTVAALFTAGAIRDLTPFLLTPRPDKSQPPWTVPSMRDAGPTETGDNTGRSTTARSARNVLIRVAVQQASADRSGTPARMSAADLSSGWRVSGKKGVISDPFLTRNPDPGPRRRARTSHTQHRARQHRPQHRPGNVASPAAPADNYVAAIHSVSERSRQITGTPSAGVSEIVPSTAPE